MKTETLAALAIDRELGELAPETAELFDAYLRADPDARREAEAMAGAVRSARAAVRRFPELAPASVPRPRAARLVAAGPWLAQAAAVVFALGAGLWVGRRTAGIESAVRAPAAPAPAAVAESPWARYDVAYDAQRGAYVLAQHRYERPTSSAEH